MPTQLHQGFTSSKGATLGYFSTFSLCEGQRTMGALGYSPLPMNLVLAAMDQVLRIPGVDASTKKTITATRSGVKAGTSNKCNNPTFRPGDNPKHNLLTDTAPFPAGCSAACQAPWLSKTSVPSGASTGGTHGGATTGNGSTPGGTTTGSGSTTGGTAPPGSTAPACDAVTGQCNAPQATADGGITPTAATAVISGQPAWGKATLALALSALFLVLLVLVPPVVSRVLDTRGAAGSPPGGGPGGGPARG